MAQNVEQGSGAADAEAPTPPDRQTRVPEPLARYAAQLTSILGDQSRRASSEQTTGTVSET